MIGHPSKRRGWFSRAAIVIIFLLAATLATPVRPARVAAQGTEHAEAVILVNRSSARFGDFEQLIKPYLDHFGFPYTVLYIDAAEVTASIGNYALIVVGHRELDLSGSYLSQTEEDNILNAVEAGTGLVNLDGDVTDGINGRYDFVTSIFGFDYKAPVVDYGVVFPIESGTRGTTIECTVDANQNPDPTVSTVNLADGQWTEMNYPPRPEPALIAGLDETVPTMECFAIGLANGEYQVFADLYTGVFGDDMTYYYGYSPGTPAQFSADTVGRSGGEDRFGEYRLEPVNITDGEFHIYFNAADARTIPAAAGGRVTSELYADDQNVSAAAPTYFGWSSIRLVPAGTPPPTMPWITELHDPEEWIGTGNLPMSGINTMSTAATVVAQSKTEPLVVAAPAGQGRAVHWASYDWISYDIKGPMYGLDDLVWRSLVWAARKPFAMQGLPPFVTMRVDDSVGPFDWIDTANANGFKPWAGLFYQEITDDAVAAKLAALANAGNASAAVHAKDRNVETTGDFYYDHGIGDLPDADVQNNFAHAKAWFDAHSIPIAKFVAPQFYELGTNVFDHLQGWGVEFVATVLDPGTGWQSTWLNGGPFRLYQDGASDSGHPLTYSDFITITGHPELNNTFLNCITEVRDDASFEWFPNNDVAGSAGRGTRQLKRALDTMAVATLFTHEAEIHAITPANLNAILQGISDNLAHYGIMGVTMDDACRYARAMHTSDIGAAEYDPVAQRLTITVIGETDMETAFYLFTDNRGSIEQRMVNVPQFTGSRDVPVNLAPPSFVFVPIVIKGP